LVSFVVEVGTRKGVRAELGFDSLVRPRELTQNGVRVEVAGGFPCPVKTTPPPGDRIASISYVVSTALRNFHQVVVPDSGRHYARETQIVDFWGRTWGSRVNNVRMPVFVLTGQDGRAGLVFGVIGRNCETDFTVREPAVRRALIAWMKRLTIEIRRGTDEYPIPDSVAGADENGSVTEHVYFREGEELAGADGASWHDALRSFSEEMSRTLDLRARTTAESLLPWWCSWTDWSSDDVTDRVILENVREGVSLGIRNFIIDDGWFGPGLDSPGEVALNIGDWREDPKKIPDLRALAGAVRAEGANPVIWCAPHAVAPGADCFEERRRLLVQAERGVLALTPNGFHSLCFACPEAREVMAGASARLVERYGVAGAKYDLFNCVPESPCASAEHEHDTGSMIEGLERTLALIDERTRRLSPEHITELKQNYATPYLHGYGTVVRAGDTPYNPEGNFLRTAYVGAYTPFALNDYQTITKEDAPEAAAAIIVKMMAVGVPSYSMNLPSLSSRHKDLLRFYHDIYARELAPLRSGRRPLDPRLGSWKASGEGRNVYFLVNDESRLDIEEPRESVILNGTFRRSLLLGFPEPVSFEVSAESAGRTARPVKGFRRVLTAVVPAGPGDVLTLRFEK
jgi:hypothetical protein